MYKEVFERAVLEVQQLDTKLSEYFGIQRPGSGGSGGGGGGGGGGEGGGGGGPGDDSDDQVKGPRAVKLTKSKFASLIKQ